MMDDPTLKEKSDKQIPTTPDDAAVASSEHNEAAPVADEAIDKPSHQPADRPAVGKSTTSPVKRFFCGYWRKRAWTLPLTVLVVVGVLFALPQTRYPLLALGLKRSFAVRIIDSTTDTPVSGATVTLDGTTTTTDSTGQANLAVRVGQRTLSLSKQYYQSVTRPVFVGIGTAHNALDVNLVATGRQVPVKVVNVITGKAVANAEIKVLDTEAKTDSSGQATIVLPAAAATQSATISASGYNNLTATVQVTSQSVAANSFSITPSGRIYFLSDLSGHIDVVSTNLDGSGRTTVLAGSGQEDSQQTVLLATTDWKYLALLSQRDGGQYAKLFLINTSNNQLTTMDSSNSSLTLVGWSGHNFVYRASHSDVQPWQSGQVTISSYSADTAKATTVDQTSVSGSQNSYMSQNLDFVNLVGSRLVYGFSWSAGIPNSQNLGGKTNSILSANADGTNKQDLKDIILPDGTATSYMAAELYTPQTLYIRTGVGLQPSVYYTYQAANNTATQSNTITDASYTQLQQNPVTYLTSPSGQQTFWTEPRDGKNSLFIGDSNASSPTQVASLSEDSPYGWFTDSYLLVEKSGSELYVMPAAGGTPLKISDYYKPPQEYYGYGGGYGGL